MPTAIKPPHPRKIHEKSEGPPKVTLLPLGVKHDHDGTSIEVVYLREQKITNYLAEDGTLNYTCIYSTALISDFPMGGFTEREHYGHILFEKKDGLLYTLIGSSCLSLLKCVVHNHNAYFRGWPNPGTKQHAQKFGVQDSLYTQYRQFSVEPLEIVDPKYIESADLSFLVEPREDLDKNDITDLVESALYAEKNNPLARKVKKKYSALPFENVKEKPYPWQELPLYGFEILENEY